MRIRTSVRSGSDLFVFCRTKSKSLLLLKALGDFRIRGILETKGIWTISVRHAWEDTEEADSLNFSMSIDMHLTNASVQKTAEDYDQTMGCKWLLQSLKMFLISKHGVEAVDRLFYDIQVG